MSQYSRKTVAVRGGDLTVGCWGPDDAPTVLAVHGVTANHLTWPLVARQLPNVRMIAPDLRGRGRSNSLPGPWGMPQHADDLAAVLDAFDASPVVVLGHSMGAFASLVLANRYPDKVSSLVLVDGGLPLPTPSGLDGNAVTDEEATLAMLGPAAERLKMTFESRTQYEDFWKAHPAFAGSWSQTIADYVNYDLEGEAPALHPSSSFDAVAADSIELRGGESVLKALDELTHPTTFISAPRGLLNEVPPLYPQAQIDRWHSKLPRLDVLGAADVNHYTIVMSEGGARAVASVVDAAVRVTQHNEVESR
ncbi:MAG: alpha/beta hydrolase [Terrimesophilobacter sp.]